MDGLDMMLMIFFIGGGGYSLYTCWITRGGHRLPDSRLLYPSGFEPKKCRKPEAYLKRMRPLLLWLGLGLMISAGCIPLQLGAWGLLPTAVLPLALMTAFAVLQRKAADACWK